MTRKPRYRIEILQGSSWLAVGMSANIVDANDLVMESFNRDASLTEARMMIIKTGEVCVQYAKRHNGEIMMERIN